MDFSGKAILVTGAASGIGFATAQLFESMGAALVIADINERGLENAAHALRSKEGPAIFPLVCDTSSPEDCASLVDQAVEQLGGLDMVCNIAGVLANGHSDSFPNEKWCHVLAVNLSGPFYISKRALPHLTARKGCIVNVASTAGLVGIPYGAAYSASKAGLIGLTKSLATEYSRRGVRVNAVCPGHVLTPMTEGGGDFGSDIDMRLISPLFPLTGKGSEPAEIAAAIAFLASPAAINMTGTILTIDGGQTAI